MSRRLIAALVLASALAGAAVAATATKPSPAKPARADSAVVAAGAKLYAQYCTICHGKTGLGDGAGAAGLKPKPRNLRDPKLLKSKNDEDLFKVISKGGPALGLSPAMVGWASVLKEPQIRQLVAFLRTLGDAPASGAAVKSK